LQNLVQGNWGTQIKNLVNIEFTNISQDKIRLQESLNILNQKLDIKQLQINSDLKDLEEKIENLQIKFQEDQKELLVKESQKTSIQQVELAIDNIIKLSEEDADEAKLEMAFENLRTKISETEVGSQSVNDVFDGIIMRLQQDSDYITALKEEYSLKESEIEKEIKFLKGKISNGEMEKENTIKIKNQLWSEMKAISDEQIELTNSIRSLDDKRQNIIIGLKEIGIEI
jgi:chromosome segregation ATPase